MATMNDREKRTLSKRTEEFLTKAQAKHGANCSKPMATFAVIVNHK